MDSKNVMITQLGTELGRKDSHIASLKADKSALKQKVEQNDQLLANLASDMKQKDKRIAELEMELQLFQEATAITKNELSHSLGQVEML